MTSVKSEDEVGDLIDVQQTMYISEQNLVSHLDHLKRTGKIEHVAFIDLNGNLLLSSSGFNITSDSTKAVIHVLRSKSKSTNMVKIKIGITEFLCINITDELFVGRSKEDFICVNKCTNFIVICTADPEAPGSCIFEVSRYVKKCYRNSVFSLQSQRNSIAMETQENV
ncbi:profilin [Mactra antiquata]